MKTITVGELRQNPTRMLDDVAAGETYRVTRHGHDIGLVVPVAEPALIVPARRRGAMRLTGVPAREIRSAETIDELIDEVKGEW